MTIREAKQRLIMPFCTSTEPSNEYLLNLEAYKMAIKALDYLPTTTSTDVVEVINYPIITCDDTISREAVKKWICKTCPDDAECQRECDIIKGIDALPPVTPSINADAIHAVGYREGYKDTRKEYSRPKGHWIDIYGKNGKTVIACRCSECGGSPKHAIKSEFCPRCGAEMVEPQKSEE